jgi:hypothetical protein
MLTWALYLCALENAKQWVLNGGKLTENDLAILESMKCQAPIPGLNQSVKVEVVRKKHNG